MSFDLEKTTEFIFDNWNVILEKEYDATNTLTDSRERYWGLDLSSTTQGAGGVGGLLATVENNATHYFHYDANGNVTETVDTTGTLSASYEYGPFGELVSETGTYALENTYKFSTKPQDEETGYYYYGYRYYDSNTGRWLNRDPIEEEGGINIYSIVSNNTVNFWDLLGMLKVTFTMFVDQPGKGGSTATNIGFDTGHAFASVTNLETNETITRGFYPTNALAATSRNPQAGRMIDDSTSNNGGLHDFDVSASFELDVNMSWNDIVEFIDNYDRRNDYDLDDNSCSHFTVDLADFLGQVFDAGFGIREVTKRDGKGNITFQGTVMYPGAMGEDLVNNYNGVRNNTSSNSGSFWDSFF